MDQLLEVGLHQLKIKADQSQQAKLLLMLRQLAKWNKTYNLTAIKDPKQCLILNLLDSLAIVPFIKQKNILDVGTGAGFPGLPLAIMLPQVSFTLIDSNKKKTRFVRQQIHTLKLPNVEVIHSRVEDVLGQQLGRDRRSDGDQQYDGVVSRAFASIQDMVQLTDKLLAENGRWLAMKGQYSLTEIESAGRQIKQVACHELKVPGLDAQRCLIELQRVNRSRESQVQTND